MRERARMNAMRSGLVVVGAVAFGYLTLQLGFRPYLEKAQRTIELEQQSERLKAQQPEQEQEQEQEQPFDFSDSSSVVRD